MSNHHYGCLCEDCEPVRPGRNEQMKVEDFRLHRLLLAGFPMVYAIQIAASEADWHLAVDMLAGGCAPETAVSILT